MGFPSKKEIEKVLKELENADPSYGIPENPTANELAKYEICRRFLAYLRKENLTQKELANKLKVDPARISEIIRYKIHLYTLDKLVDLYSVINPNVKVKIS